MNPEIVEALVQATNSHLREKRRVVTNASGDIVSLLPNFLVYDAHPLLDEEHEGKGECTTAIKYFLTAFNKIAPKVDIKSEIVTRSFWEPLDKNASAHVVAKVADGDTQITVDPTHFMGCGFGQVHDKETVNDTVPLSLNDWQIIEQIKTLKHKLSKNAPEAEKETEDFLGHTVSGHLSSWLAEIEWHLAQQYVRTLQHEKALSVLKLAASHNPFKAGIIRLLAELEPILGDNIRTENLRDMISGNLKRLSSTARTAAQQWESVARNNFRHKNEREGLYYHRLSWWANNVAENQIIPCASFSDGEIQLSKLSPYEFRTRGLITVWTNEETGYTSSLREAEHRGYKEAFSEAINLFEQTADGYFPIDLASRSVREGFGESKRMVIRVLEPTSNKSAIDGFPGDLVFTGADALLHSVGVLYPQFTTIDTHSIEPYYYLQTK